MNPLTYTRLHDTSSGNPRQYWTIALNGKTRIDDGTDLALPLTLDNCDTVHKHWATWIARWQPRHLGCLRTRVDRPEDSQDPCLTAPDANYRGQENQLYRVEIHQGGSAGEATFKWSRDNGVVVSRVELSGTDLVAEKPLGFAAGIWVELSNDGQDLRGQPGTLVKLLKVEDDRLTPESQ